MVGRRIGADLLIERSAGSTQDSETGVLTEGTKQVIYDGQVRWEDGVNPRQAQRLENQLGVQTSNVDFTLFLKRPKKLKDIALHDKGVISFRDGTTANVEVIGIRKIDSTIYVTKHG